MQALDDIEHDSPQAPSCDTLTQLGDALEREEFLERVPALQLPWDETKHPSLTAYRMAKLAALRTRLDCQISLTVAKVNARRAWQEFEWRREHREQGGLRRVADSWARHLAAEDVVAKIEQQNPKDRTRIIKNFARRKSSVRSVPWRE
jgi:hypothetical protein